MERIAWEAQLKQTCKPSGEYMMMTRMAVSLNELLVVGNEMLTVLKLAVSVLFAILHACAVGVLKM